MREVCAARSILDRGALTLLPRRRKGRRPKAGGRTDRPPKRYHFDDPCLAAARADAAAIHAEARTGFGGNLRVEGFSIRTSLDGGPVVSLGESTPWYGIHYTEVHGSRPASLGTRSGFEPQFRIGKLKGVCKSS